MDLYLPALSRDHGGSPSLVQLTLTACLLGLAAGHLIVGPLSDVLGWPRDDAALCSTTWTRLTGHSRAR